MRLSGGRVAAAYRDACLAELQALKPGNVHVYAAGHDMTVADFETSAEVSAAVVGQPGLSVGERIYEAVRQTRAVTGCNTNLGILLLCAPLAQAALGARTGDLRQELRQVLDALDVADAELTFRAIRLAQPGGLGTSPRHDVAAPATVTLRAAMAEARHRDRIADQYVTAFEDVFTFGLPRLRAGLARWVEESWATTGAYMGFLARFPDSHIARKFGAMVAGDVRRTAAHLDQRLAACADPATLSADLTALDTKLKAAGLNPGTSADLTVASLFALRLENAASTD
ncbi:triphosphoribosyl-dephospho-CoA synthase [Virgifigura deserti]|uniref:triphosphoribosyl-dephospho-CoA synthase n=1 Tax=Virgifigura deserti TaxID=2268457 RepID=UPI003CCC2475